MVFRRHWIPAFAHCCPEYFAGDLLPSPSGTGARENHWIPHPGSPAAGFRTPAAARFSPLPLVGEGLGERGFFPRAFASFKAVSVACRRPSHFSLLAQREVTKRNGLFNPPTLQASRVEDIGSTLVDTWPYSDHPATYLETEEPKLAALRFAWLGAMSPSPACRGGLGWGALDLAVASARRSALLFPGPLGDGEAGTKRPRSGRAQGWARLFARAGARSKSPAPTHGLSVHGWTESDAAGCRFLLATSLLGKQKRSSSGAGRRTKPLCRSRYHRSKSPQPSPGGRGIHQSAPSRIRVARLRRSWREPAVLGACKLEHRIFRAAVHFRGNDDMTILAHDRDFA